MKCFTTLIALGVVAFSAYVAAADECGWAYERSSAYNSTKDGSEEVYMRPDGFCYVGAMLGVFDVFGQHHWHWDPPNIKICLMKLWELILSLFLAICAYLLCLSRSQF